MRRYYIFKIKSENLKVNSKKIYDCLEELFYLNTNKFKYGLYIFNNLCTNINKNIILEFLIQKYKIKDKSFVIDNMENTFVEIKNAFIIIKTNKNISTIFKYLNELEKNLFVCDFDNKDFFWLNEFIRLNLKISI